MKKILLLGSPHGNELLGDVLMAYITANKPELLRSVTFRIGNPKAKRLGVRFIETDLNRSFNGKRFSYEERRAAYLLRHIMSKNYDLVLDLHTTTCNQQPCLIVPALSPALEPYLRACPIQTIVEMNHKIVETSLIGVYPRTISIEVYEHALTPHLMEQLALSLEAYLQGSGLHHQKTVYQIDSPLAKNEITKAQAEDLVNFTKSSLGFYPVLVGENSYKKQTDYLGFKAYKVYQSKV